MNRRELLGSLVGGIVLSVAVRTFPFRVFSFPENPHIPKNFYQMQEDIRNSIADGSTGIDVIFERPVSEEYMSKRRILWREAMPPISKFELGFVDYEIAIKQNLLPYNSRSIELTHGT
jgi:hypothetical protein